MALTRRKQRNRNLGKKLKLIRSRHDLTQASMLCIINPDETEHNRARISQYESGTRYPSLIEVLNYARFAGIPVEVLIDDKIELDLSIYSGMKGGGRSSGSPVGKKRVRRISRIFSNRAKSQTWDYSPSR